MSPISPFCKAGELSQSHREGDVLPRQLDDELTPFELAVPFA
jgi:hypothetical protein